MPTRKEKQPLSVTHPELAKEAVGWDPSAVTAGSSSKKQLWECKMGHQWQSLVAKRTIGQGCPFCSNQKVLSGFNDFEFKFPVLANEADGWDPSTILPGSHKKLGWKCLQGHRWTADVASRVYGKNGCPVCANLKILVGYNDLNTTHPELSKQADGWNPITVVSGSKQKMKWKCEKGHQWTASLGSRSGNRKLGCPICSGQRVLVGYNDLAFTHPDIARQALGWNPSTVTAGSSNKKYLWVCDKKHQWETFVAKRTAGNNCPTCSGRKVLVGFNDLKSLNPKLATEAYEWDASKVTISSGKKFMWQCHLGHKWITTIASRTNGTGCPYCSNYLILSGFNDLDTTHPEIAKQAVGWDTSKFGKGYNKKMKWRCSLGHEWYAAISSRTGSGTGCPVCQNKRLLIGFNDLETKRPDLAVQAIGWNPQEVISGAAAKKKWKCADGHIWTATVDKRVSGRGCPTCAKSGFDPNSDGYLYFLEHSRWEMFQIGISNYPDDRIADHKRLGWEVLELHGPMDGHLTQQWETAILRMLKAKGADLSNAKIAGKFDGYSEAWSKSTFEVKSIKELMRLTEDFETENNKKSNI